MLITTILLAAQLHGLPVKTFRQQDILIHWQEMPETPLGRLLKPMWKRLIDAEKESGKAIASGGLSSSYSDLFLSFVSSSIISGTVVRMDEMGQASTNVSLDLYNWRSVSGRASRFTQKQIYRSDIDWRARLMPILTARFVESLKKTAYPENAFPRAPDASKDALSIGPVVTEKGLKYIVVEPDRGRTTVSASLTWAEVAQLLNPSGPLGAYSRDSGRTILSVPHSDVSDAKLGTFLSNFVEADLPNFGPQKPLTQLDLLSFAQRHALWNVSDGLTLNGVVYIRLTRERASSIIKRYFDVKLTAWRVLPNSGWKMRDGDLITEISEGDQAPSAGLLSVHAESKDRVKLVAIEKEDPDFISGRRMNKIAADAQYRAGRWVLLSYSRT